MADIDWEILIHGGMSALEGYKLDNHPYLGATAGFGIGAGAVYIADNIISQFMGNPEGKKTPAEAMVTGAIEDTISTLAMSVLLSNPITMESMGMGLLYGIPEGLLIHSLEGEVDWKNPFGWD